MQNSQNRTSQSALSATPSSDKISYHKSLLAFESDLIDKLSYIDGSFTVAASQRFHTPTVDRAEDVWMITFDCDGQLDPQLAIEFTNLCGGADRMCTIDGDKLTPDALNFYAKIDVTVNLNGDKRDVSLFVGQGANKFGQVWWLGGLPLANANGTTLLPFVNQAEAVVQVLQVTNRDGDLFQLTPWL
ncbi:hypothetical protein GOZ97_16640 [Agrobacterium vitis]|uniref:hypothetical protein n=1 Tax=Rhizobium/Agrobacterium group TaxID=227290 RepID=UPI0008FB57A1|nr:MULTISPECIES: hypothetical protein [Rhizobium/Agrobacterium group]MCF1433219.1 hypothetical protein [Allorhizobium ampelinum]MUO91714.1 hypothetical protein [Agrobacterium vitis]MUZ54784.1 hypothetical protein [Agrobacterium vitis]MUZ93056.1 hypothetical protein [Agrobacterium vitis]MVA41421.1 hypothetical protein [Agrobacterium vitis]